MQSLIQQLKTKKRIVIFLKLSLLISLILPIVIFIIITVAAVTIPRSSGYLSHMDSIDYDGNYFTYEDVNERFDAIYNEFIVSHDYIRLSFFEKLNRLTQSTVEFTNKLSGGECHELSVSVVSRLSFYDIPSRVVIGRNSVAHTWIEVYLDNEWYAFDPTDDIYRYKNSQIWGVYRSYENYKVLFYL